MKIRKAVKKDFKVLARIMEVEYSKKPYNDKWKKGEAVKTLEFDSKNNLIYVATVEGKVVGFVIFGKEYHNGKYTINVEELAVNNRFHGFGIGKKLMEFVERYCRKNNIDSIHLSSNKKSRAFKFYKKLRYVESKNFIHMYKELK